MSAIAISAPRFNCSPNTASPPVIGPATETTISCAFALATLNAVAATRLGATAGANTNSLERISLPALDHLLSVSAALTGTLRDFRIISFIVTPDDLRASARLFPGKIFDIQASHRLLWGDVHLAGIAVEPEALRLRARQEIKNTELRLRLRAVERGGDPDALWRGMMASLPKIAVTLETLLRARGLSVPSDRPGLLRLAGRELGIPEERLEPFTHLRRVDRRPDEAEVRRLYAGYLDLLAGLSRRVEETAG